MTTYTITVGDRGDGIYGFDIGFGGSAFGSVSPSDGDVVSFIWANDGSAVAIISYGTAGTEVAWNGHTYILNDEYSPGYVYYSNVGLGGPYPTSGTTTFDTDEVAPPEHTFIGAAGAYALTGYPATLARGGARTLAADPGIYALTGYDAALTKGFAATITVGSFSGFIYGYQQGAYGSISWASGSAPSGAPTQIAWTSGGFSVQMAGPRPAQIILNGKTYTLSGYDGSYTRSGAGLAGPYPTSGTVDILFSYGQDYLFGGVAGAYALTGMDAVLSVGGAALEAIAAAAGSYVLTGYDATLSQGGARTLAADAGAYVLTGMDAAITSVAGHVLSAGSGAYTLTGGDASIYILETEMTVPWPETLPCQPEQGTWSEAPQSDVLAFRPESGPAILRRRSTVQGVIAQSTWVFTAAQYATFRTFYRTDLQGGAIRFSLDHPLTGEATEWVFEAEPQMTAMTNRKVRVQMQWRGVS